jgi:hypothetical protein
MFSTSVLLYNSKPLLLIPHEVQVSDRLERDNVKLKYFETHFTPDLSQDTWFKKTKTIVYGKNANPEFEAVIATEDQEFSLEISK